MAGVFVDSNLLSKDAMEKLSSANLGPYEKFRYQISELIQYLITKIDQSKSKHHVSKVEQDVTTIVLNTFVMKLEHEQYDVDSDDFNRIADVFQHK